MSFSRLFERDVKVNWDGVVAVVISFDPAKYGPDQNSVNSTIMALRMEGHCIDGDARQGQIQLRFNPVTNKPASRRHAVRRIKAVIMAAKRG